MIIQKYRGLPFAKTGRSGYPAERALIEPLDSLPFPVRSDLFLQTVGGNILASRGCYGQCSFCYINNFYGNGCQWRGRSPDNVAQEIAELYSRLSAHSIYFVDANFFGRGSEGRKRALEIVERIGQMARPDASASSAAAMIWMKIWWSAWRRRA